MSAGDKTFEWYGGYRVQSESGVDLTLLRGNLNRTPDERIQKNRQGIRLVRELDRSRERPMAKQEPRPELDAEGIVRLLARHGVEYVLVGGLAMRMQGSAHITEDLDICYRRTRENMSALANALAEIKAYLRGVPEGLPFLLDAATLEAGMNFTFVTKLGDIDTLGQMSGIGDYDKAFAQSDTRTLFDVPIRVLSLDGLIAAKKAAGRVKDKLHLLELEELKKMRDESQQG